MNLWCGTLLAGRYYWTLFDRAVFNLYSYFDYAFSAVAFSVLVLSVFEMAHQKASRLS